MVYKNKKRVRLTHNEYDMEWYKEQDNSAICVDVYKNDDLILEWGFPFMTGTKSLQRNADFWQVQAGVYADQYGTVNGERIITHGD